MELAELEARLLAAESKIRQLSDIEEIKALMYEYGYAYDDGRLEDFRNCFTEDCYVEFAPFKQSYRGRDDITRFDDTVKEKFPRLTETFHFTASPVIEVDGDTARGRWHWMNPSTMEKTPGEMVSAWQFGVYRVQYRRQPDGWKIAEIKGLYLAFFDLLEGYAGKPLIRIGWLAEDEEADDNIRPSLESTT